MRIGLVLSGCGVYDGAEIHEAVLTMLALEEAGAEMVLMAPSGPQMHVIDHLTGRPMDESRDIRVEAARIARGPLKDMAEVTADELDALIFVGGFGAAKNLCNFAVKKADCTAHPDVARLVGEMHRAKKPIGFECISPTMAAAVFRDAGVSRVKLTVGSDDDEAAAAIDQMGAVHIACPASESLLDSVNKVVSTPAYMQAKGLIEVRDSVKSMVDTVIQLIG